MNTQVKVGIAAAIVAALVALIVLDQKTTPKDDAAQKGSAGGDPATIVGTNSGADAPAQRIREDEINSILENAKKQFGDQSSKPATPQTPTKGTEEKNEKRVNSTATGEEYVIKTGDTLEKIATKHKTTAAKILEANPGLKATALRVDKSIKLPKTETAAPTEKKDEAPVFVQDSTPKTDVKVETAPKTETTKMVDGKKTYTVQPGDTLSGISVKVYNTSRHYQKIYEANKDAIEDPNTLQVGLNLVMPDLPSKTATANTGAPGTGAVPTTVTPPANVPAGAKSVTVNPGDRLWNIAAKFAAERKVGIMDMIKIIVDANVDKKIREDGSNLQAGWQLIIPE